MHQAKVLGRKGVADLMRPGVEGMALNARLHPDRVDLLPKMLLGIAALLFHRSLWRLCGSQTWHSPCMVTIKTIMAWCLGVVSSPFSSLLLRCCHTIMRFLRCVLVHLTRGQDYTASLPSAFYA